MTRYVFALVLFNYTFVNIPSLHAEGLVVRTTDGHVVRHAPSLLGMAKRYESKGDYIPAILIYEELLSRNPRNRRILRKMIECHETMVQNELKDAVRYKQLEQIKILGPQLPDLPEDGLLSDPLGLSPIARQATPLLLLR